MFGFGRKKILGVDIGTSALKIVELELRKDRPYLSNYTWMPIPDITEKINDTTNIFFETTIPECLVRMIKTAKLKEKKAYMAIPALGGIITIIDFPKMPSEDMEQAIKYEAHKYIPTSLDEVSISWDIIGDSFSGGNVPEKKIQVFLVAASKSKILSYEKIAKEAHLQLKGIEIENIAMVNALVGNDKGNFIIVDIGYRVCNIVFVEKGIIRANRNIDAGGNDFTRTIVRGMGITEERAEAMKISGKNFFKAQPGLHFSILDLIIGEVSRILDVLPKNGNQSSIDALILSGGTASLVGLKEFFEEKIGVRTIIGNPFSRVDYDKKLEPVINSMKSRFSVSMGLALKGLEMYGNHKNK